MSISPKELELQELHQQLHKLRALLPQFLQSLSGADDGQSGRDLYYTVARGIQDWRREAELFLERWRIMEPMIESLLRDGASGGANAVAAASAGAGTGAGLDRNAGQNTEQGVVSNGAVQGQDLVKADISSQTNNNGELSNQGIMGDGLLDDFPADPGLYSNDFLDFT